MSAGFLEEKQSVGSTSLCACHRKPTLLRAGNISAGVASESKV